MSIHLRKEKMCIALVEHKRCTRPATELGGYCGACWKGLSGEARAFLRWEAAWTAPVPVKPSPKPSAPSSAELFEAFYADREAIRLHADIARWEAGP